MSVTDRPATLWADTAAPVEIVAVDRAEANSLLVEWRHELGACDRPFGQDHWLIAHCGRPVSLAVSASIVSPTIRDEIERTWPRNETLELARLCSAPGENWATRVMLRLWRECLASQWVHWEPGLLVSYATPGKAGNIYRADGWTRVRTVAPSKPGASSTWAKGSPTDGIGNGRKTLWVWHR